MSTQERAIKSYEESEDIIASSDAVTIVNSIDEELSEGANLVHYFPKVKKNDYYNIHNHDNFGDTNRHIFFIKITKKIQ